VGGVELVDELDAAGDRAVGDVLFVVVIGLADEDGAGAAVAFGADDLGAGEVEVVAEEI
jgi:hypothetical protein